MKKLISKIVIGCLLLGNPPPAVSASTELVQNDRQQFVPVVSYDPTSTEVPTSIIPSTQMPSGVAIQSANPLSAPSKAEAVAVVSVVSNGDFAENSTGTSFPDGWGQFWTSDASNPQYLAFYDGHSGVVNLSRSTGGMGMKQDFAAPFSLNAAGQFEVTFKVVSATLTGDGYYGIEAPFVFQLDIEKAGGTALQIRRYFNYTSDGNSASNPNFALISQNQWVTKTFTLQDLGISSGDKLKSVAVFSNGWNRETYVDSIGVYSEDVPPVEIAFSGGYERLPSGSVMTVAAATSLPVDSYAWYLDGTAINGATTSQVTAGNGLAAGSHTLMLWAMRDGVSYAKQYSFSVIDLNQLQITFSGMREQLPLGSTMDVVAATSPWPVDSYQWYLDGTMIPGATSRTMTVGNLIAAGDHSLKVVTTINGVAKSQEVLFSVIDLSPLSVLDIADQYALAGTAHWAQNISTFTSSYWDHYAGSVIQYHPITSNAYTYGDTLQLNRSYAAWNPPSQTQGHTYEDRALVEFDLSRWYQLGYAPERIARVELLATVTGSGEAYQNYAFSVNSMQALEDGAFTSAQSDFGVTTTPLQTFNLSLNSSAQDILLDVTDYLRADLAAGELWSGLLFKPEAANLSVLQLSDLSLRVYYDTPTTVTGTPYNQSAITSFGLLAPEVVGGTGATSGTFDGWGAMYQQSSREFSLSYDLADSDEYVYGSVDFRYYDYMQGAWVVMPINLSSGLVLAANGASGKQLKVEVVDDQGQRAAYFLNLTGENQNYSLNFTGMGIDATHVAQILFTADQEHMGTRGRVIIENKGLSLVPVIMPDMEGQTYDSNAITALTGNPSVSLGTGSWSGTANGTVNLAQTSSRDFTMNYTLSDSDDYVFASLGNGSADAQGLWTGTTMDLTAGLTFAVQGPAGGKLFMKFIDDFGNEIVSAGFGILLTGSKQNYTLPAEWVNSIGIDTTHVSQIIFTADQWTMPAVGTVTVETSGLYYAPPIIPPMQPIVTSTVPVATNATTLLLSGTKDANTSIWINGAEAVVLSAATTWTAIVNLPAEGNNQITITAKNATGLASDPIMLSVLHDTQVPTGSININSGAVYATSQAVTLNLSGVDGGSGIFSMSFSTDTVNWSVAESYAAVKSLTLPAGDGTKTVYVKYFDRVGNVSLVYSDTIVLDMVAPAGSIAINAGAPYATSASVTLNLSGVDTGSGIGTMSFSGDGTTWSAAETYAATKAYTLASGDGTKTIFVRFYDKAGNVTLFSDSIILDTLAPTGTVKVNGGTSYINQPAVTLNLSANDAGSGISAMSFSTNGTTWGAAEAYAATKAWTFTAGDGTKSIYVKFLDNSGKWSAVTSTTVSLDTVKPTGSLNINSGAAYATAMTVTLNLSGADALGVVRSGVSKMSFSTDGTTWTPEEAYATSKVFTLPSGDGTKTVNVKYFDRAGNVSAVYSKSIFLDCGIPTGSININSGATYATSTSVTLSLAAQDGANGSGVSRVSFSTNGTTWTTPVAYAASKPFTLPAGDGTKTVCVRYYDRAGNVSAVYSKSIVLDTTKPTGSISINSGAAYTAAASVTLTLGGADGLSGIDRMSFSTNGTTWTPAEAYATSKVLTLPAGDGTKTVYVRYYDRAGNVSAVYSKSIVLDTTKPTGTININSGAAYATATTVTLNLSGSDARSGISGMMLSTDGVNWSALTAYATSKVFTLPSGDGTKTVYVKYYDRAGNVSAVYSKSIILDTLPPTGAMTVNGGATAVNQTAVTLNLSAADAGSGLGKMSFSSNGTSWTTAENYAATKAWIFAAGDGNKTVYVKFQDKYGRWSAPVSVTVALDMVKPTGSIGINSGAGYTNSTNVTLNLSGSDNVSGMDKMSFSTDGATWSSAEAYATSKTFALPAGDGAKTVYVKYFDRAGNVSTVYSSSIVLDTVPPNVVLDPATPAEINTEALTIQYTVDGVVKTQRFEGLTDGENTLTITETDLAGNQTVVNWKVIVSTAPWVPAVSNANYSFRVLTGPSGYRLELRYNPSGGITVLSSGNGPVPDTFDVTPDGRMVIYENGSSARVERIGEPWTAQTVQGDLTQILYYNNYVMLKTDHTYPSGTVIRTSTGIRISTFNPEFISTFYLTLVTPGAGFYRNDALSIAVQPEYDQDSGQYYALIYNLYGGNDYSSSVRSVSLGQEAPGTAGGSFTLVDAVVAPGGATVIAVGLDSSAFNKTYLINQNITFDGAATSVTYQNNIAIYTVRDNDGLIRTVRFDLEKLEILPELPAIEFVQPVITQTPNAGNQWTLKLDQAMRGVRYEVLYDSGSGVWQTAGTFVAASYGEASWQDPSQDRGPVVYSVIPKEITTAADLLTQINMLYLDADFGLVEPTHEYPLEGWLQRRITQPSNFGFYANLLATIASGDLVTATISKAEAIRRLDVMMTQLLADQQRIGHLGLLPWLGYYHGDWQRMDDLYGRQVSFEDNTNMSAGLAVAYGALLDSSLAGNAVVNGAGGILEKIDAFLENQRDGYLAMYNSTNQTFARTMVIPDGRLEGTVDLFGAESSGTLLFLILQYGDAFPASAYAKLHFSTSTYAMQDGTTRTVVEPFSGAFQMYWPALLMPEQDDPDLRAMLETYTDVLLDYADRNNQPGILSASYDVGSYDLLSRYVGAFSWAGDVVSQNREADGSFHVTSPTSNGIGVYFTDDSKFVLEGSTMQLRYSSQTAVPNARLEFKQMIDGVLQVVHVENLSLENTGGEVRTLTLTLSENGMLGDLKEVVFAVSEGTGALDLTFHRIDTDRIQYNFSLGINEIAMNGVSETTPSTYNLGAAYMFRPAGVEALLQRLINEHPELITSHGLWEGINMTSGKVVKEQVFNNVVSFMLGMAGTGGSSMARYLEHKGLTSKLESIWDSQAPVFVTERGAATDFAWDVYKGTSWKLDEGIRASNRQIRITYQSDTVITGAKLDLKYASSGNDPVRSILFDLSATGGASGEVVLEVPENFLYWYISEVVVVFPEQNGYPSATIDSIVVAPAGVASVPVVAVDPGTPALINTRTFTLNYQVNGVARAKFFEGLVEGTNTLSITPEDVPGLEDPVTWTVTVDTIAPAVVLDPATPTWIASSSFVVYYTLDGTVKQKIFTDLSVGVNALSISEVDPAGNRTTVNLNVSRPQGTDFLKGQITTFALNGGNAAADWDSGVLHVTSSNFKGVGVAAIMPGTSINVRQVQISYSSLTPVPNARIEYKARNASGQLIIVKTQYLNLQNTGGVVKTVTTDLVFSGYPAIDEIVFVAEGAGTSSLDMKFYGFAGF